MYLDGQDVLASDWKYVPVRRLAPYIEESLYRGTQWVVFEPNDEPLWGRYVAGVSKVTALKGWNLGAGLGGAGFHAPVAPTVREEIRRSTYSNAD